MSKRLATNGINLGGWLVIERWMTPSLFKGTQATNERELIVSGHTKRVVEHFESFITGHDLDWIKSRGIEVVRIPVGYWVFGDVPPYVGAIDCLDWLFDEATKRDLKVLLDLHAAPGGQNDEEHGGAHAKQKSSWLAYKTSQGKTIQILERLAQRYGNHESLWGIQLLNEPLAGRFGLRLARFYRRAFTAVRPHLKDGVYTVFSDGYAPLLLTNALGLMGSKRHPVVMDCHLYYCFSPKDKRRTFEDHLAQVARSKRLIGFLSCFQPIIVGEWSAMLPNKTSDSDTKRFTNAQLKAYRPALATFYWNYKTEPDGRWNYRDMVGKSLID